MHRYFIIHKPFQVLSQFSSEGTKKTLKDITDLPSDIYPVGRLDYDSEGLLVLTNDKALNHLLLDPKYAHEREYWVQVEGLPTGQALKKLSSGIIISVDGKSYKTKPCIAEAFKERPAVAERFPPIRFRKSVPDSWIRLIMKEGKNRQVRKMTAAAGMPTLRLIRYRIEKIDLAGMEPGDLVEMQQKEIYQLLSIKR
jgi:23S rRNA pseudouridine2457 synthase